MTRLATQGGDKGGPSSFDALLDSEFEAWEREPTKYLGLTWSKTRDGEGGYSPLCPPLLFIGGGSRLDTERPLVIVSLEPLLSSKHFESQCKVAKEREDYRRWNLEYFDAFPELTKNARPQAYWRNLVRFVEGWSGARCTDPNRPWAFLGANMMELPFIPMHARRHVPAASAGPATVQGLSRLFAERTRLIRQRSPGAVLVVLAAAVRHRLDRQGLVQSIEPVSLQSSAARAADFGKHFAVPIYRGVLNPHGMPAFLRHGPFSNWTNPTSDGRYAIGQRLREVADEHAPGSRG